VQLQNFIFVVGGWVLDTDAMTGALVRRAVAYADVMDLRETQNLPARGQLAFPAVSDDVLTGAPHQPCTV
jgi:hypothetical protein